MQNKYAKACAKCNATVQPYKGVCEKVGGQWIVEHTECHTPATYRKEQIEDVKSTHPAFVPMEAFQWMEDDFEQGTF